MSVTFIESVAVRARRTTAVETGNEVSMTVMTLEGVVEGGQIRLKSDIQLPDNTTVYVVVPGAREPQSPRSVRISTPHLLHRADAADFVMRVIDSPGNA